MPHLTVEYTANLDRRLNVPALLETLHRTASGIDAFPLAGIRTRAHRLEHYRFADGHADNQFVHVVVRLAHGRSDEVRKEAGEVLFRALCEFMQPIAEESPLALSLDMQEMAPELSFKQGNIRDYIAARSGQEA